MDAWGPVVCRKRLDEITGWLVDAAKKRGWLHRLAVSTPGVCGLARVKILELIIEAIEASENRITRPEITTRNLIYHVCPLGDWRLNLDRLIRGREAFNGRRVLAVVEGDGLEPVGVVREYAASLDAEILVIPNDRDLRETATFRPLLDAIQSDATNEATFYGHTKGNSTADDVQGAILWRNVMYDSLVDRWADCIPHLTTHPMVGTHKMIWPRNRRSPFPTAIRPNYPWMHCGTFWWFRHDAVFSNPHWEKIEHERYGVEAWPAQMFNPFETKSVWQPWEESETAWPQRNPYDPGLYFDMDYGIADVERIPMKIGFDLDQTIYGFPELFREIIHGLADRGHKLYMTSNHFREHWDADKVRLRKLGIDPDLFDTSLMQTGRDDGAENKRRMAEHVDYMFDDFADLNNLSPTPVIVPPHKKAADWRHKPKPYIGEHELKELRELARSVPAGETWVEVGCWAGNSLSAVGLTLDRSCSIVGVENWAGIGPTVQHNDDTRGELRRIVKTLDRRLSSARLIEKDSVAAAADFADASVWSVFLDGDHSEGAVVADIDAWRTKIKPGGIICGHDYTLIPSVKAAVDAAFGDAVKSIEGTTLWWVRL